MTDTPQGAQNPAYRQTVTQTEHTVRYAPLFWILGKGKTFNVESLMFNEECLKFKAKQALCFTRWHIAFTPLRGLEPFRL